MCIPEHGKCTSWAWQECIPGNGKPVSLGMANLHPWAQTTHPWAKQTYIPGQSKPASLGTASRHPWGQQTCISWHKVHIPEHSKSLYPGKSIMNHRTQKECIPGHDKQKSLGTSLGQKHTSPGTESVVPQQRWAWAG